MQNTMSMMHYIIQITLVRWGGALICREENLEKNARERRNKTHAAIKANPQQEIH